MATSLKMKKKQNKNKKNANSNAKSSSAQSPSPAKKISPTNLNLTKAEKHKYLRQMLVIRRFEEKSAQAFTQAKIKGFCHLYIGQEALAVGSISILKKEDAVITAYRDHGHAIAKGMGCNELMAELFGKATGCSRGKGGSMHFFDAKKGFYGGHGIVGGQTPLGAGIAFAQKYLGEDLVTLCYLGDGAINQGAFHEALNLAQLWKLPVIYIIENNEWSMGTSLDRSSAYGPGGLSSRADAYGMAKFVMNGMDLDDVRRVTAEAVDLARTKKLPSIIDARTYRYRGHSMSDPGTYRSKEDVEKRRKEDPIELYKYRLIEDKDLTEKEFEKMEESVMAEVEASYEFAEKSPDPAIESVYEDIFAPETDIDEIPRDNRSHF
jgi:pyruvate dehydrogenase E1 component alpha subunit